MRIGALVVARQRPGTAKGITFMLIEDEHDTVIVIVAPRIMIAGRCAHRATDRRQGTPGASSRGGQSDQSRRSTRYAKVDPIEARNRNPPGIAETSGFVAETPSDCRLRCRNPTLNGEGFGNAHRTMTQQARAFSAVDH